MYRLGVDLGSSYTKGVVVDTNDEMIECVAVRTGYSFSNAFDKIWAKFFSQYQIEYPVYSCGYGREQLKVPFVATSEIVALAKAVFYLYRKPVSVLDIGGQDTKFIKIKGEGTVENFKLNRKCAAGTGSFLEEIAYKLDIAPERFNELAEQATEEVRISSFCTVFAVSEIVGMLKKGIPLANIALGVYHSIVSRAIELAPLQDFVVLTGGIPQKHPGLVKVFKKHFPNSESHPNAQFLAAYGNVLLANSSGAVNEKA
jgi:predicted CoA-substrate-specific enzyme activase